MERTIDSIKKWINKNKYLFIFVTLIILFTFSRFIFFGKPFKLFNDQVFQYNLFYEEWLRLLKDFFITGELPYYSWYSFLGQDFLVNKIYYCTFDFMLPIIFVLNVIFKKSILTCLLLETILLIYISAISSKYFFKRFIKNNQICDLISIIYAFSGCATLFFGNYMWHRFYAIIPLLFLGVEKYLDTKKTSFFSIIVCVLFLQNYYLLFPTSFFLIGYYIASYNYRRKDPFIVIIKSSSSLIVAYIVGILMAGLAALPTILIVILGNSRLGVSDNYGFINGLRNVVGLFFNTIVPPLNITNGFPNIFFNENYGITYYSTYASVLATASIVSFKKLIKNTRTKCFSLLIIIYSLVMIINPLNNIMHAFSQISYRWVFLIIFIELLLLGMSLEDDLLNIKDIKMYLFYGLGIVGFLAVAFNIEKINFKDYTLHMLAFLIYFLLGLLYFFFLSKKRLKVLIIIVALELGITNLYTIENISSAFFYYEESLNPEYVSYFLNNDDNRLVRIYINPHDIMPGGDLNLNNSLHYGYLSTAVYDSTIDTHLNKFLIYINASDYIGVYNIYNINDIKLLKMLGVKYYGVYDESLLPEYKDGYEYSFDLNAIKMYKLNNYNSIAHTYSSFIKESNFSKDIDWNNTLIIKDEDFEKVKDIVSSDKKQLQITEKSNNHIAGNIQVDNKAVLFTSIPYSDDWHVTDENNYELEKIEVNGGFLGIILNEGNHVLNYYYSSSYFKYGLYISVFGFILFILNYYREKKTIK